MIIKLIEVREENGACPTRYTGKTKEGLRFEAYLRHGGMSISVNGVDLVSCNVSPLDGVCTFTDFKNYAERYGYFIDDSSASWSSKYEDMEKLVKELFKDHITIVFVAELTLKSLNKTFLPGETKRFDKKLAEILVQKGYAKYPELKVTP